MRRLFKLTSSRGSFLREYEATVQTHVLTRLFSSVNMRRLFKLTSSRGSFLRDCSNSRPHEALFSVNMRRLFKLTSSRGSFLREYETTVQTHVLMRLFSP
ncbi:hypothetical protein WMY93_033510 [Mugilogobius chulae]|uniref:Uncharacterized protein n=1 Tax=Mugilogobius chulae TaxID=88201 RepID=A0AAW0MH39_9GOBI